MPKKIKTIDCIHLEAGLAVMAFVTLGNEHP